MSSCLDVRLSECRAKGGWGERGAVMLTMSLLPLSSSHSRRARETHFSLVSGVGSGRLSAKSKCPVTRQGPQLNRMTCSSVILITAHCVHRHEGNAVGTGLKNCQTDSLFGSGGLSSIAFLGLRAKQRTFSSLLP